LNTTTTPAAAAAAVAAAACLRLHPLYCIAQHCLIDVKHL
jgi:hypothetical protein